MGPPGSGKGTQGALLAERFGIPRLSTGDMIRAALQAGTAIGEQVRSHYESGRLAPDAVVLDLIAEELDGPTVASGFLLDGFPRTAEQADGLAALLAERELELDAALSLDVPRQELIGRISGRRVCGECGFVTHVRECGEASLCPECGASMIQRSDDSEDTVRKRLLVYGEETEPLLGYYARSATGLTAVDGVGTASEVQARLLESLHERRGELAT